MTCLGRVDRQSARVHRSGLLGSGAPDEAKRMVLSSAVSAECWHFLAKPLKIEFESIPNDNTRNVLGIS